MEGNIKSNESSEESKQSNKRHKALISTFLFLFGCLSVKALNPHYLSWSNFVIVWSVTFVHMEQYRKDYDNIGKRIYLDANKMRIHREFRCHLQMFKFGYKKHMNTTLNHVGPSHRLYIDAHLVHYSFRMVPKTTNLNR